MFKSILLLGKPASGKGTLSQMLKKDYKHISTGDILREEIKKETKLGQYIKELIDNGNFVDNNTMLELLKKNINPKEKVIFDGYPRNKAQIPFFEELIKKEETLVVIFKVPDNVLIERIKGRIVCQDCSSVYNTITNPTQKENICDNCGGELVKRKDDSLDIFNKRLDEYNKQTKEIVNYFYSYPNIIEVNEKESLSEVSLNILSL